MQMSILFEMEKKTEIYKLVFCAIMFEPLKILLLNDANVIGDRETKM